MSKKRQMFFAAKKFLVRTPIVSEYADGEIVRTHSHPWHQLVYASQGEGVSARLDCEPRVSDPSGRITVDADL
ncbi:MAG: hypothetical protein ACREQB_06355, partial [Candidatus Binataceae bacterium]